MNRRKGYVSAVDLMAKLQSDPEWVAQNAEREAKRVAAEARFRVEEEPIIRDLAKAGYDVGSVYDLVNTTASYPSAIPVLLDHLSRDYHPRIRQGIGRALAVVEAQGLAGPTLLHELRLEKEPQTRWVFANTLTIVADRADAKQLADLVGDPQYADVHDRLSQALKNVT
jgi:hypothetical protein